MAVVFESDGKALSGSQLLLRGIGFLVATALVVGAMIAKSEGAFQQTVGITAVLVDVGDGLPAKSDVKYQGVLVGAVESVTPSTNGGPNYVHIDLLPRYVSGIPDTVTARVVPSNVFGVPSIQLINNGSGSALAAGAEVPEDRSLATVRLQTSLTALSRIVAAAGRSGTDPTLGILTTVELATSGRGADAVRAGAQLEQIVKALNSVMAPDGTTSTLSDLAVAVTGLRSSAPELLGAVHDAVVPLRAVAQERTQLTDLLTGGLVTFGTIGTALDNNTGRLIDITGKMSPVLDVLSDGGRGFVQMTTAQRLVSTKFNEAWSRTTQNLVVKVIVELTPHKPYTRADCPRYGNLAGPSCTTDPVNGPPVIGGNVGQAGDRAEQDQIASIMNGPPNAASDLLIGPLLRGNDVTVTTGPAAVTPGGGHP